VDGPKGTRYRARMFAPSLGFLEDPATGAAATAFPGWLVPRLGATDGVLTATIEQGIEMGRPSTLMIEIELSGGLITVVRVGGTSVPVCEGTLVVPE
jgi:trans-2,3-dihydro-3-hydroxyanthranilate isomerase